MPGDKATTACELWYAQYSNLRAKKRSTGFFRAPTAIGISGHKSRTSKTNGIFFLRDAGTAGKAIVNGVLVAKMTSPSNSTTFFLAIKAKAINAFTRL